MKRHNSDKLGRSAVAALEKLQASDPAELARVLGRFSQAAPLLERPSAPGP